jgi:hypothetical protein
MALDARVNRGAIAIAPALIPPGDAEDLSHSGLGTTRWRPHPMNVSYVRRFLDLSAAHRLPVYWLIPPVTSAWQSQSERLGHDDCYTRFVQAILVRYANLVIVDGRLAGYTRPVFTDSTHLNARGATALSGALASTIRPRLANKGPSARWVTLPAYRDRPDVTPMVEDFGQSQIALGMGSSDPRRR